MESYDAMDGIRKRMKKIKRNKSYVKNRDSKTFKLPQITNSYNEYI